MFTTNVPNHFWGEAVLTASYLINRLPSKPLQFSTPIHCLQVFFPYVRILQSLPPKVFGCTVFVHNSSPTRGKLDPKSHKCIFLGYSPSQKGYKCYCPNSKKFYVSCDTTFLENQPFLHNDSVQGENIIEPHHWDPSISLPISLSLQEPMQEAPLETCTQSKSESTQITSQGGELEKKTQSEFKYFPKVYTRKHCVPLQGQYSDLEPNHEEAAECNIEGNCTVENLNPLNESVDELDLPVALRKGVRSCTKHSIKNFLTYSNLSPRYRAFVAELDSVQIPNTVFEALKHEKWRAAVLDEMAALEEKKLGYCHSSQG